MSSDDVTLRGRRAFLTRAASIAALTAGGMARATGASQVAPTPERHSRQVEPFWGPHQAGIATRLQKSLYFAVFDLTTERREDLESLLRVWTEASARMTAGETAQPAGEPLHLVGTHEGYDAAPAGGDYPNPPPGSDQSTVAADSGEVFGLPPARLTITLGFGAGIFTKDGKDRYGLAARRPEALVDLPKFPGDQLVEGRTGGDIAVQSCADDPQIAFHAVRELARMAEGVARIRWAQTGFTPSFRGGETPRNLMGFKDGSNNPSIDDPATLARVVWVGNEGPAWMRGGSYLVARRIRIALEHWDRMKTGFQEHTVGRKKESGAPLGQKHEFEPLNLAANDADGNPIIPENSHVRLAAPANNDGVQMLRRPYSYNDGVNFTAERWPPWRQAVEYDAGLFFMAYQRDPRTAFIKIQDKLSRFDMMNQFVTPVGGGLFAMPGGAAPGGFIGERLFV